MNDGIDFSDRERFILSFFRDTYFSGWRRRALTESSLIVASLVALALYLGQHDAGYGVVAYALLLWRVCTSLWRSRGYTGVYRSILVKYEARVRELTGAPPADRQDG